MSEMDKILVSIGADLKDLEKGFATATSKTKDFENKANKIGKDTGAAYTGGFLSKIQDGSLERGLQTSFNKMGKIADKGMMYVTAPLMAAGVGLTALSTKAGQTAKEIGILTKTTGMTAQAYQEWDYVLKQNNYSMEQASGDIAALGEKAMDAANGAGEGAEMFGMLGIQVTDATGKLKSQEQIFNETIAALQGMEDATKKNAIASALLSTSGEQLAPVLAMNNQELSALKNNAHELGLVLSDETIDEMIEFNKTAEDMKARFQMAGLQVGAAFAPILEDVLVPALERGAESLTEIIDKVSEMDQQDIEFFGKLALGAMVLPPIIKGVSMLGQSFLTVAQGARIAIQWVKGFEIASMTAHLPLMGGLALLGGALALFVYTLWNAEDESISTAENIGDEFAMLGQKAMGLVQMVAGVGVSVVGMAVSAMGSLVQLGLNAMQDLLEAASKMPLIGGLAGWGADKLGAASDYVGSKKNGLMNFGKDVLDQAEFRMNSSMDAVYTSRAKKGKLDIEGLEYGDNGFLTGESLEKIKKEKDRQRMLDGYTPNYNMKPDYAMPGLPELPEIPGIDEFTDSVDKMGEALKKMGDDFQGTVDSLRGSIGLFDRFRMKTTSTYRLLRNSQERANAFNERERVLQSLGSRGLSEDLMNQLRNTSIENVADLRGLEMMNNDQLQQWAGNQYSAESTMKRQAANQVTNNTIYINLKQVESEEFANKILKEIKRKGISFA